MTDDIDDVLVEKALSELEGWSSNPREAMRAALSKAKN